MILRSMESCALLKRKRDRQRISLSPEYIHALADLLRAVLPYIVVIVLPLLGLQAGRETSAVEGVPGIERQAVAPDLG